MFMFTIYLGSETSMWRQVHINILRNSHENILYCGRYDDSVINTLKKLCGLIPNDKPTSQEEAYPLAVGNWYKGGGFFICEEIANDNDWHITVAHDSEEKLRDLLLICESLVPACSSYFELFKNGVLILSA